MRSKLILAALAAALALPAYAQSTKTLQDNFRFFAERVVLDSQHEYASKVVPAKRFYAPPYSFAANYYWPEHLKPAPKGK